MLAFGLTFVADNCHKYLKEKSTGSSIEKAADHRRVQRLLSTTQVIVVFPFIANVLNEEQSSLIQDSYIYPSGC